MMLKYLPIAAVALASLSAHAVQKDITVTASIDPTVEMLSADGSALPQQVQMQYLPGVGLRAAEIKTRIFSNDKAKDLQIRLTNTPELTNQTNPGAEPIPLAVQYNGKDLTATPSTLSVADIFPGGIEQGSNVMALKIAQKTAAPVTAAGSYLGTVSVVLTQSAATPPQGGK